MVLTTPRQQMGYYYNSSYDEWTDPEKMSIVMMRMLESLLVAVAPVGAAVAPGAAVGTAAAAAAAAAE
jgi:hypothetical protein